MNSWVKGTLMLAGGLIGGLAVASAIAGTLWNRESERMVAQLNDASAATGPAFYSPDELRELPDPVVRYFQFTLVPGQPLIRTARIEHQGEFRGAPGAAWSPFHSVQHFSAANPGFVWDAKIRMAPLMTVRVRDSYIAGRGAMLGKLAALIPVVDQAGTPHLNAGALHRLFLESTWLPTSLLPSQGVRWEPIDDHSARATLSADGLTVSMDVHFGESGEIVRVEADRMRDVDGSGVETRFVGHVRNYSRIDGMMVPIEGEVAWILPEGRLDFWRGRIVRAQYGFAQ